jgi:hypothetical protein
MVDIKLSCWKPNLSRDKSQSGMEVARLHPDLSEVEIDS